MKTVTRIIVRVIGVILLIIATICAIKGFRDGIFNGVDFAVAFFGIVGAYLTFGSEENISSWKIQKINCEENDCEKNDCEEDYEYNDYGEVTYPFPNEKSEKKDENFDD